MLNLFLIFCGLLLNLSVARADLSTNPWLEPNDEEEIAKVYQKKRYREQRFEYDEEDEDVIEIDVQQQQQLPDEEQIQKASGKSSASSSDGGVLNYVKSVFNSEDDGEKTDANFVIVGDDSSANSATNSTGTFDMLNSFGVNKMMPSIPVNLRKPNVNGWIQRLERASGVNFKSLARKMKGK